MPDPTPLFLVGAGGFGREVAALVEEEDGDSDDTDRERAA